MSASVAQALASTLSADAAQRAAATEQLESLERDQYRDFVHLLSTELANDAQQSHIRNAAGIRCARTMRYADPAASRTVSAVSDWAREMRCVETSSQIAGDQA